MEIKGPNRDSAYYNGKWVYCAFPRNERTSSHENAFWWNYQYLEIRFKVSYTLECLSRVFEDNEACQKLASSSMPKMTPRLKYIAVKYHWFREYLAKLQIEILLIGTKLQLADIFTKWLVQKDFESKRKMVCGWWKVANHATAPIQCCMSSRFEGESRYSHLGMTQARKCHGLMYACKYMSGINIIE